MKNLQDYDFSSNIHIFNVRDLTILLDVNSGAIHLLDDLAHSFIDNIITSNGNMAEAIESTAKEYPFSNVEQVAAEIVEAVEQDSLFTDEERFEFDFAAMPIKALCLNVAHMCNMRCRYCFASQGDFGGKPSLMSKEVGCKALDFLVANSGEVRNLEVDFFGGEPLMNFKVVKYVVEYGRQIEKQDAKKFNFTLTTNALLLDEEVMDFILKENISIILSLDGRPEVNDYHRILADGGGSYHTIVPHIQKMISKNPASYYIRGTFTCNNLDFANDLKHIIALGGEILSLEPAVGPDNPFSIKEEDLPKVLSEYERITDILLDCYNQGKDILFFHYNLDLQRGPCLAKRSTGCGAGFEYLAITPEGEIYPCHQFVGDEKFLMGTLDGGEINRKIIQDFASNYIFNKEECCQCWARFFCGGGCHANNYKRNGDISIPDHVTCIMHRKRLEEAIYLQVKKRLSAQ